MGAHNRDGQRLEVLTVGNCLTMDGFTHLPSNTYLKTCIKIKAKVKWSKSERIKNILSCLSTDSK